MKRVLYVLANEPTGGVGVFVRDFTSHFDEWVHIDYLIYTEQRDTAFQKTIRKEDTRIWYLPELTIRNYIKLLRLTDEFFYVHHSEFDAVHLTYPGQVSMVLKPAEKYGIPCRIIHSFNTRLSDNPLKSIRNKAFIRNYKKYANVFLACSRNAGEYLYGKKMVSSGKVQLIMNAINCDEFRFDEQKRKEIRQAMGIPENDIVVLSAGRLEEQKNIAFAVEVFAVLKQVRKNSRLYIVGDGPLRSMIENRIREKNLEDSVYMEGFTDDLNRYFLAADVLLFPSLYEGLPITVVDAQCCGLPCVLSDTISDEVVLTELVEYCSLQDSYDIWAEKCLGSIVQNRTDHKEQITEKGYNISEEAGRLEQIYIGFGEKNGE